MKKFYNVKHLSPNGVIGWSTAFPARSKQEAREQVPIWLCFGTNYDPSIFTVLEVKRTPIKELPHQIQPKTLFEKIKYVLTGYTRHVYFDDNNQPVYDAHEWPEFEAQLKELEEQDKYNSKYFRAR